MKNEIEAMITDITATTAEAEDLNITARIWLVSSFSVK